MVRRGKESALQKEDEGTPPRLFPFAPVPWDATFARSEDELERDAAQAPNPEPAFEPGHFEPDPWAEPLEVFAFTGNPPHADNEEQPETTGEQPNAGNDEAFSFSGAFRADNAIGNASGFSFAPVGSPQAAGPQMEAVTSSTPAVPFSFTSSTTMSDKEPSQRFFESSDAVPLQFGAAVEEGVQVFQNEELQAMNLQMPTASFSHFAEKQSRTQQLEAAVGADDADAVRRLVPQMDSKELEVRNWGLETVIVVAAREKKWEIVEILADVMSVQALEYCDGEGRTALNWAAAHGNVGVLKKLLQKMQPQGKDLTALDQQKVLQANGRGQTPLHEAVRAGQHESLKALVEHYAVCQINLEDKEGKSALSLCVEVDADCSMAQTLVDALPPDCLVVRSMNDITALDSALMMGNEKMIDLLLDNALPEAIGLVTPAGTSLMGSACSAGNFAAVKKMAEKVPGIVVTSHKGPVTPLGMAAGKGHGEIVDFLLLDLAPLLKSRPQKESEKWSEYFSGELGVKATDSALVKAMENNHYGIALKLLQVLPMPTGEVLGKALKYAFGEQEQTLLKHISCCDSFDFCMALQDKPFAEILLSAPLANYEILMAAHPEHIDTWLDFNNAPNGPLRIDKFRSIISLARKYCLALADNFHTVLSTFSCFALRTKRRDLFVEILAVHDNEFLSAVKPDTILAVIYETIRADSLEYLDLCLEHLPEHAWYEESSDFSLALFEAARGERPACLRMLLDALPRKVWSGVSPANYSCLIHAVHGRRGHLSPCLAVLLEYFSEEELMKPSRTGSTALHISVGRASFFSLAEALSPESLLAQTPSGATALHIAARKGKEENVYWLLEHMPAQGKAMRDNRGNTAADYAEAPALQAALRVQPKAALAKR